MAEDYIEEAQREAMLRFGKELSADELATEFAKHKLEDRIYHLKSLKAPDEDALSMGEATEAYERFKFTSKLRDTHETLRKVGR